MNRMADDDEAKILAEAGDELWKWTKRIIFGMVGGALFLHWLVAVLKSLE